MITEVYKEMCLNNPDLQELWKPKAGDRVWTQYTIVFYDIVDVDECRDQNYSKHYWLPYQEDLQELIHKTLGLSITDANLRFDASGLEFLDWNERWMAVLMLYKFSKKWDFDKKEWIKI